MHRGYRLSAITGGQHYNRADNKYFVLHVNNYVNAARDIYVQCDYHK